MLFWIGCAVLTALVVGGVVRPLLREAQGAKSVSAAEADIAVYQDQLSEIDSDETRGLLGAEEAEAARTELSRRLLRRQSDKQSGDVKDDAGDGSQGSALGWLAPQNLVLVIAVLIPMLSLAGYLTLGAPNLPSLPYAERFQRSSEQLSVAELVGKVEQRLRRYPEDGKGWDLIGPVYIKQRRFDDAAIAFQNAARILGETPDRLLGFAEARVLGANGVVGEEARKAFARVLELEPDRVEPRFWLATAKQQDGDLKGAITAYEAMLKAAPEDAPWREVVVQRLQIAMKKAGLTPTVSVNNNTSKEAPSSQVDTSKVTPAGTPKMPAGGIGAEQIIAMVEGLASRLEQDGDNIDGWLRLIRSYKVLGRLEDAKKAAQKAKMQFANKAEEIGKVDALLQELQLED